MAKKKQQRTYKYECTISGEAYKLTKECPSPDELVGINAYYELNPEEDDRPESVKNRLGINTENE